MDSNRTCGECFACCTVAEVRGEDFVKPSMATCPYLHPHAKIERCLLHNTGKKPPMCATYRCAWIRGCGDDTDRPDRSNVMVSVNRIEGSPWIVAMDLKKNAHLSSGKQVIVDVATKIDLPVIVVDFDHLENGKGDFVIIKDSLLPRAKKIMGEKIVRYTDTMNVYKLIISPLPKELGTHY